MNFEAGRRSWNRRFRIMMRHTWLIILAAVLLGGGIAAVGYHFVTQPTELTIAVGPPNSDDARVVQLIGAQLAREQLSIRLHTKIVGGSAEAAAAVEQGNADLAVVRRDSGMPRNGQAVAILRKNVVVFIVPAAPPQPTRQKNKVAIDAKPIEKIEQVVGKRVGVIGRSPRNLELLKVILRQYGISPDQIVMLSMADLQKPNVPGKINVIQLDPNTVSTAIKESAVDVIMSVGPVSSSITADAIAAATRGKNAPTFLSIDASEAIAKREPGYDAGEIKAGAFGGSPQRPEESVETIEVHHFIVARRTLSEDVVADFTKHLFAIRQNLGAETAAAAKIEKPDTDKDASVAVHPGAAAYLDGELKTFFERYSDLLYYGLMALSVLGSGFAGLLSYSKADDRIRKLRTLERLLEIVKAAHGANSIDGLDELQAEIDTIQADVVRDVEANTLDGTAITAYAISIQRAQLVIFERRSVLATRR